MEIKHAPKEKKRLIQYQNLNLHVLSLKRTNFLPYPFSYGFSLYFATEPSYMSWKIHRDVVCTCVCVYVCVDMWMGSWLHVYIWTDGWMHACMHAVCYLHMLLWPVEFMLQSIHRVCTPTGNPKPSSWMPKYSRGWGEQWSRQRFIRWAPTASSTSCCWYTAIGEQCQVLVYPCSFFSCRCLWSGFLLNWHKDFIWRDNLEGYINLHLLGIEAL